MPKTIFLTHILLIVDYIIMIYCMVVLQKKHKFDYKISLTLFPLVIVIISTIIAYFNFLWQWSRFIKEVESH